MSARDNGGPAFPYSSLAPDNIAGGMSQTMYADNEGMTLRDYFAAKAMQGICASGPGHHITDNVIAREAYSIADAMLAARGAA